MHAVQSVRHAAKGFQQNIKTKRFRKFIQTLYVGPSFALVQFICQIWHNYMIIIIF